MRIVSWGPGIVKDLWIYGKPCGITSHVHDAPRDQQRTLATKRCGFYQCFGLRLCYAALEKVRTQAFYWYGPGGGGARPDAPRGSW